MNKARGVDKVNNQAIEKFDGVMNAINGRALPRITKKWRGIAKKGPQEAGHSNQRMRPARDSGGEA
jgi:hypothetical protein